MSKVFEVMKFVDLNEEQRKSLEEMAASYRELYKDFYLRLPNGDELDSTGLVKERGQLDEVHIVKKQT